MPDYTKFPEHKQMSASHIMLFCILLMYVLVGISCVICIWHYNNLGDHDNAVKVAYALCSYSTVCGSSTIIVYANKASKENNLQISNSRYRMKLDLAKEIYRNIANNKLDDKSIALISMLAEDEKSETLVNNLNTKISEIMSTDTISTPDALG